MRFSLVDMNAKTDSLRTKYQSYDLFSNHPCVSTQMYNLNNNTTIGSFSDEKMVRADNLRKKLIAGGLPTISLQESQRRRFSTFS